MPAGCHALSGVAWTVVHAYQGSEFFRLKLEEAGVDPRTVHTTDDLARLPLTTKQELRDAHPFGWTCVPLHDVVRVHASTGTTGRRVVHRYLSLTSINVVPEKNDTFYGDDLLGAFLKNGSSVVGRTTSH